MFPKFPCFSMKYSLFASTTSAPPIDASPCGWYFMHLPTTVATFWNLPSSISKSVCIILRCTGLSPSSMSGIALSRMT